MKERNSMLLNSKTKSCPFCGNKNIYLEVKEEIPEDMLTIQTDFEVFVECEECGAQGPFFYKSCEDSTEEDSVRNKLKKEAVEGWNRRYEK